MNEPGVPLRNTELYKKLTLYKAVCYVEKYNEGECATEREQLVAMQYLVDNKLTSVFRKS